MVRLSGGKVAHEGRVEVRQPGSIKKKHDWATVCDIDFTVKSAEVLCKQLGHREVIYR